jgi:hypothetical protein
MRTILIMACALSILILSGGHGQSADPLMAEPISPEQAPATEIAQTYVPGWYSHGHRVLQMPPTPLPTTDPEGSPVLVPDELRPAHVDRFNGFLLQP